MGIASIQRILIFLILLLPVEAISSERYALLIGNSRYEVATPLRNPENDIELVGPALEKSGFTVTKIANAKAADMLAAMDAFIARLATVENPVVMVYFAGHGVQIAGENYLLPVDTKLGSEEDLRSIALSLSELVRRLDVIKSKLQIIVLDSCRDNPFDQTRGLRRGLATAPERLGRILAFSTSPGNVATDGDTGASPYATAFAESVRIPGLSIEGVFKRVRATVQERTGGKQEPWENSAVYGDFQFVDGRSAGGSDEVAFFEFAALADSQEAYQKYLSRYPEGLFASLARQKIEFMDKDFSFRRQSEAFRHFTFGTSTDDPCGRGDFGNADGQTAKDIADGEIILLDLYFPYADAPCKNTVFFDSLRDVEGSGFSKNVISIDYFGRTFYRTAANIPFDPVPYADFLADFNHLIFTYRRMHDEGEILVELAIPTTQATDYITIDSCEGTCFSAQLLAKARVAPAEELLAYRFEVVNAAELGLTWKYQNTLGKLKERQAADVSAITQHDKPSTEPFRKVRTVAGWDIVAVLDEEGLYLQNCQAMRGNGADRLDVFRLDPYGGISIGFVDRQRRFADVTGRPFTYRVDGSEMPYITRVTSGNEIAYKIASTPQVLEALKTGREVGLHDGTASLAGSSAMLADLQACIAAFGG